MQPVSAYKWTRISGTAAGTTVITPMEAELHRLIIPQQKTGTVTFYDNTSGTTGASLVGVFPNTAGTIPVSIAIEAQMRAGIVAETGGTTDFIVLWK